MSDQTFDPLYEVASGQILLHKRNDFYRLHSEILLPIMKKLEIKPILLLVTEIGRFGRFLDVYAYKSLSEYESKTDILVNAAIEQNYYQQIGECVHGGINIELMKELPYFASYCERETR